MFPLAGHSIQWIWTGFGVRPHNLRMVMRGLFLHRNHAIVTPKHCGQLLNVLHKGKGSSYQPRPTRGRRCSGWACVQKQQLWCLKWQGTNLWAVGCVSYSRGGTATGRLEAGQLNTVWVYYCCRLSGVAPANSIGLTQQYYLYVRTLVVQ